MKDYYLEQANRLETQIAFAKVGYEQEVKAIAKELAECPITEVEKVTKRLVRANEAIKALYEDGTLAAIAEKYGLTNDLVENLGSK